MNIAIEEKRASKLIGSSLEADVEISLSKQDFDILKGIDVEELFITSHVKQNILKGIKKREYLKILSWLILIGKRIKILPLLAKIGLNIAIQGNSFPINTKQDLKKIEIGIHRTKLNSQGLVGLYTGCIMNEWFTNVHKATISVLNKLGYDVFIPENDVCCGALHSHSGDSNSAIKLKNDSDFQFINCGILCINPVIINNIIYLMGTIYIRNHKIIITN